MKNRTVMKYREAIGNDVGTLIEDARGLLTATADVAEGKVIAARKRLAEALDDGNRVVKRIRHRALDGAKAADDTFRHHPYETIGIALGVGLLLGLLFSRREG